MKNTLILLAGYPGTGKTFLANRLMEEFPGFTLLSPDQIKEEYWDAYGFENLEEKEILIGLSWKEYYRRMEEAFEKQQSLISDYPFSEKQKDTIWKLTEKYQYQTITIRLTGDLNVLFERQRMRDLDESRHPGHIVCCYKKGRKYSHKEADNLLDYREFEKRCTQRGYGEFALGKTLQLDVTDFQKADYRGIFTKIALIMR